MWKLTVEREYIGGNSIQFTTSDNMFFESEDLEELQIIIGYFDKLGTGGKFKYKLERKEGEGNAEGEAV